jgi:Fic family protein
MKFDPGSYRQQQSDFKAFIPSSLINNEYRASDKKILSTLGSAMHALGELNAYANIVPDADIFLEMYITKEAVTSSGIEGTKTNVEEALSPEDDVKEERRNDWQEVQNYIAALQWGVQELKTLPLSIRLLKGIHFALMQGVRGKNKLPGEIRTSQNWIGGATPATAKFVPPPFVDLPDHLSDLERFWHQASPDIPPLIRIAMSHYQFETIHPFLDGNGRTGRLLIIMHLMHEKLLNSPVLYLSAFLEEYRQDYFDHLERIRTKGDMDRWILFFLGGVEATAISARKTMEHILQLKKRYEKQIASADTRTAISLRFLEALFSKPIVTVQDAMHLLSLSKPAANSLVNHFAELGILKEITGKQKNRVYSLWEYVALFDSQSSL